MGLFDAIDRLNTTEEQPERPQARLLPRPPERATAPPRATAPEQPQPKAEANEPDTWGPSPEEIEHRRRILNRKPERLSFLHPCPICQGRSFLHIEGGGFVCRVCTPGLFGYPVEATGPERQTPPQDEELLPAGHHLDTAARPTTDHGPTAEQREYFKTAWRWIKEHRAALLSNGWTMATLTRRAKYRWPVGPWGLAWMPVWCKPCLVVAIGRRGEITFSFQSSGRSITQTARPPAIQPAGFAQNRQDATKKLHHSNP